MVFDDSVEDFFAYHQSSFESPDLRPIPLSMSSYDKSASLDGIINLQAAGAAFPDSNAFAHFYQPVYNAQLPSQPNVVLGHAPELEPDCYSEGDFPYPIGFVDEKAAMPMQPSDQAFAAALSHADNASRKRKSSQTPEYAEPQPRKRAAVTRLQLQDINGEFHDISAQTSPYSSVVPTPGNGISFQGGQDTQSPRFRHSYSTSNASAVSLPAPSPHTPAWSPSFTTVKTDQSPRAPMTPAPRPASTPSTYSVGNPKLVRTSTIPQQASPSIVPSTNPNVHTQNFNPYAMYPHNKATLKLGGDLDAIALKWSSEELEARRKLIVFTRSQTGSTIDAEFKVVAPEDWQRGDITVNCIWWKERKEAFVTSVDTIALLEQLVAVRFTVEEKNRIRRNLEGFRPLTVSKAKPDSEEFFKVIMGFANPKPRNIEKDVKVFPWKILAHALKKIIGKYSASYSSTASTIMAPSGAVYINNEQPAEYHYAPSPNHELMHGAIPAGTVPLVCYDHSATVVQAPVSVVPGLSLQVPTMGPAYEMVPHPYPYDAMSMTPQHATMTPHSVTTPIPRMPSNWTFDQFEPHHFAPGSAPPSAYPQRHVETADFIAPYHVHHG